MSNRITESMLQARIALLNKLTNSPAQYMLDGQIQVGHFHFSHAYGGVCLHRTCNTGGGAADVLNTGHIPKREAFGLLCAFINGIEHANR